MSKRIETSGGVIQRANATSAAGSGSVIATSSKTSRTAAARCATSPSPSCASTAPPGKTHAPPMNRAFVRALHHQHLEALRAAAQDHDRGRLPGRRGLALVENRAGLWTVRHHVSLICAAMSTETARQWICESCGFIYDPAEGDPDGGIPAGTAFEDIPGGLVLPGLRSPQGGLLAYEG